MRAMIEEQCGRMDRMMDISRAGFVPRKSLSHYLLLTGSRGMEVDYDERNDNYWRRSI